MEDQERICQGLFNRINATFGVIKKLPETMSDEEVEGLLKVMPRDPAETLTFLLRPEIRDASLAFFRLLLLWLEEAKRAKEEGKKVVLLPFSFPPELIHCFDNLFPLTSEVLSTLGVMALEGQGEEYWDYAMGLGLPDHICSSSTIELGSALMGRDLEPDAIISATVGSCDANSKIHEFVAHWLDIPQIFLEKPPYEDQRGLNFFKKCYGKLVCSLEELAEENLRDDNLYNVINHANRATELHYDLWELKKQVPCPVPGIFSIYTCGTRWAMWGREEGVQVMEKMVEVARKNLEDPLYSSREELARTFWIYTGYYYDVLRFFTWMEERKVSHLGEALMVCFPRPIDTSSRESMLEGMAESAWHMFMTRQIGGDSMSLRWLDDMVYILKDLGANCAIYPGHHACKQTWSVFSIVRSEIARRTGIPTLGLHGDCWVSRTTPMSAVLEEVGQFIDNVVLKKPKKKKASGAETGM